MQEAIGENISAAEAAEIMQRRVELLNKSAEEIEQHLEALDKSAAEIADVAKTISNIARQTLIVSFNASIESARASEQGAAFAVVANEVGMLAKQVQEASNSVGRLSETNRAGTKDARDATHKFLMDLRMVENESETLHHHLSHGDVATPSALAIEDEWEAPTPVLPASEARSYGRETSAPASRPAKPATRPVTPAPQARVAPAPRPSAPARTTPTPSASQPGPTSEPRIGQERAAAVAAKRNAAPSAPSASVGTSKRTLLQFDPVKMGTGVDLVDEQHRQLISAINKLDEISSEGKGMDEIRALLDFLGDYVAKHFADEERIMAEHDCPVSEQNIQQHKVLVQKYTEWREKFDADGGSIFMVRDLLAFLRAWLTEHICRTDTCLKNCVKG